jgi:hypothetical protein
LDEIMADLSKKEKEAIVTEAKDRLERCQEWENRFRKLYMDDVRFSLGDSDNQWQWHNRIRENRELESKPCLTINKVRQHNLLIINDIRQNKSGVIVRPVGGGATFESAQAIGSIVRYIEYHSNARDVYSTAVATQIMGGVGYWRVMTEYADETSFDQEIYIRRIPDPLMVFIDPDARELDKSDANFAFIYEDLSKEEFEKKYPDLKGAVGSPIAGDDFWLSKDRYRVAEYFRVKVEDDEVVLLPNGMTLLKSQVPSEDLWKEATADSQARVRKTTRRKVEWFEVAAGEVVDVKEWLGKYIPIVQVVGEEYVVEGKLERSGHTRALKDPQRMYNYWSSAGVEYGALQTKIPYIGPAAAFEDFEQEWLNANKLNLPYLPYKHRDEELNEIPAPQRTQPPTSAPVALAGMEIAEQEIMRASGQFQAQLGEPGNERSGKAILKRQGQSDNATAHFLDNFATGIRFTGKILLDIIPKIYDTQRVLSVMAEDGTTYELMIDPEMQESFVAKRNHDQEVSERIINPSIGRYEVHADIGPSYATKREEAFDAFATILTQAPELAQTIGDILFRAADFPLADEAAERLRRMVPRQALGLGPSQSEQELTTRVEQLTNMLSATLDELAQTKAVSKRQGEKTQVDAYEAITGRLKVLAKGYVDEQQLLLAAADLVKDVLGIEVKAPQQQAELSPRGVQGELPLGGGGPRFGGNSAPT